MKRVPAVWVVGVAVAAALLASAAVSGASAQGPGVKVTNETSRAITHLFSSIAGEASWAEAGLGQAAIKPGQSADIAFDDSSGDCKFDLKVTFEGGDEVVREGVDVCKTKVYRLAD